MNHTQQEIVQSLLAQVDDLMDFLEPVGPLNAIKKEIAHDKLDELKTNLETYKKAHHSINKALVNLRIRRRSNPYKSEWHHHLYNAHFTLGYWLSEYKDS